MFLQKMGDLIQKKKLLLVSLSIFVALAIISFLPSTHLKLGNLFFGGNPSLYNLQLAQYFFTYSSYPLLGQAPEFSHYQLSRTNFIQGRFETAIAEALVELELYPHNTRTYYILGLTYGYTNRELDAIEAFSNFIEHNPDSWAARNDKAWLQFRIGDVDGALETMEPVANFQNPWVQNTRGTLLLNMGKVTEAKQAFIEAQEIVSAMSEEDWGRAYPGNDPRIYAVGLSAMRTSIANNLTLVEKK